MIELLSRRLKEKRKECGLKLTQVNERTGLSISFLSDVEVGRSRPSLDTLEKLAECYGTTIPEFFIESEAQEYVRQVYIRMLKKAREEICAEMERLHLMHNPPGIWLLRIIPSEDIPNGFKRTDEDNVFVSPQNYELMRPFSTKGVIIALGILTEVDPTEVKE